MSANPVYKWFSALLCYPEAELIKALPEFQAALKEWPELQSQEGRLKNFLDEGRSNRPEQIGREIVTQAKLLAGTPNYEGLPWEDSIGC